MIIGGVKSDFSKQIEARMPKRLVHNTTISLKKKDKLAEHVESCPLECSPWRLK